VRLCGRGRLGPSELAKRFVVAAIELTFCASSVVELVKILVKHTRAERGNQEGGGTGGVAAAVQQRDL